VIDCVNGEIRDLLPDFVHGSLDVRQRREVDAHVRGCDPCAAEVSLLRELSASLRAPERKLDVAAIVAALPAPPARRTGPQLVVEEKGFRRRGLMANRWLRYAAAVAVLIGAGSVLATRTSLITMGPRPVVAEVPSDVAPVTEPAGSRQVATIAANAEATEIATPIAAGLTNAELEGLLDEISSLESAPPAESEEIVRGIGGISSGVEL
jgi:anti-sigma factor RsiW